MPETVPERCPHGICRPGYGSWVSDESNSSEDKGSKAGMAAILPLIIMSVLAILVLVWIFAH
jgi:hypothetical protein